MLGVLTIANGFDQRFVFLGSIVGSEPFRVLAVVGYAALAVLLVRPGGWLTERIAAVGRAAFTNYLGTSISGQRDLLRLGPRPVRQRVARFNLSWSRRWSG